MRRQTRRSKIPDNHKNIWYIGGSLVTIGVLSFAITFVVYGNKMDQQDKVDRQKIASLVQESTNQTAQASTQMGKTVEEAQNIIQNVISTNTVTSHTASQEVKQETHKTNSNTVKENKATNEKNEKEPVKQSAKETKDEKQKLTFIKPVEGEKMKDYAKDTLVYSNTLEEWTTHLGWDLKAEKTTVVKAAANGTVKSIKNDPRYGLSIIIEHQEGYQTLYANLLSTEFVKVGENVKQGQSIGTVGNTAAFEVADEPHLHFEISQNGKSVDPNQWIQ